MFLRTNHPSDNPPSFCLILEDFRRQDYRLPDTRIQTRGICVEDMGRQMRGMEEKTPVLGPTTGQPLVL